MRLCSQVEDARCNVEIDDTAATSAASLVDAADEYVEQNRAMYCDIVAALASSSSAAQGTSPAETRTTGSALAPSWSEAAHAPAGHIAHRETGGHAGTHAQSGSNGSVWLSGSVGGEGDGQREEEMGVAPGVQLMSTSRAACKMGLGCGLHVIVVETALPGPRLLHGDARGDGAEEGM